MCNNTLDEDDYKKAVRNKYEKEKDGIHSNYLNNPSQANLRDLCWKIFKSNEKTDDLNVYSDFFKFKFDSNNEDTSTTYTDKFKKVGRFFKGETKPAKIDTINFAAVLVDFEFRPFAKFKLKYIEETKVIESFNEPELSISKDQQKENSICNNKEESFKKEESLKEENETEVFDEVFEAEPVSLFLDFKKELPGKAPDKIKRNIVIVATGVICLLLLGYYFTQKKQCMQWSGDHYEEVSCDLKIQGIGTYNVVEPLDERIINLRKIQACDTTTFFKNGEAVIWYAKVGEGVDFFNTHGRHPENNKPLKPVTQYIIDKYVK